MPDNGAWPDLRSKGQSDSRVLLATTFHSTFLTDGRLCSITPGKCAENASERIEDETEVGRIPTCGSYLPDLFLVHLFISDVANGGDFGGENGFCVECACLMRKVQGSTPGGSIKYFAYF